MIWASGFGSLVLIQCYGQITWNNILANVFQQELVYRETIAMQELWPREYQWETGIIFDEWTLNSINKKGQSLIHKAENLLDIICDNFDCPLFDWYTLVIWKSATQSIL